MKDVAIILSHCDTEEKLDLLKETILVSKNHGLDVIVTTHIPVPDSIYDLSDYVIYDKDNPIITHDEYEKYDSAIYYFINHADVELKYNFSINHGYTSLKLIKNGVSIAQSNGYEVSHIINYDYIIHDSELIEKHKNLLKDYDVVTYNWDNVNLICAAFFSTKTKKFNDIFIDINSKKDYCSLNFGFLEELLYHKYFINGFKIHLSDINTIKSKNVIDKIKVNDGLKRHIIHKYDGVENPKFRVFLCEENNEFYLVIISNDDVSDILINGSKINLLRSDTNIFKIKKEMLIGGLSISIPDYNHFDTFDINTRTAECNIKNQKSVIELF